MAKTRRRIRTGNQLLGDGIAAALRPRMMMRAALVAVLAAATPALADEEVKHVDHLVVVTPNPPVIVTEGGPTTQGPVMSPDQPQAAAPQNEDWNNVSHINGVPVKVGERGDYLYKFRRFNISTDPLAWMVGMYQLSASYAITDNIVIRGDVDFGRTLQSDKGTELGVSMPIYLRRAYSGPFIEPGLVVRNDQQEYYAYDSGTSTMSTDTHVLAEMMIGWHWSFDSGLNLAVATGLARPLDSQSDNDDDVSFAGYFRVGYSF